MKWLGSDNERDIKQSLMDYLPKYYENSKVVNEIMRVDAEEMEEYFDSAKEVLDQFFVNTATWGLDIWERQLGLTTIPSDSYQVRRARIISRLNSNSTFGIDDALSLANLFTVSGTGAWFTELPETYEFRVSYEIDNLIDVQDLYGAFEDVKPAHLYLRVGLHIAINFLFSDVTHEHIKQWFNVVSYEKMDKTTEKLSIEGFWLVNTQYDAENMTDLFTNGSWKMDGSEVTDGKNDLGITQYIDESEKLTITVKNNNQIISQEVV